MRLFVNASATEIMFSPRYYDPPTASRIDNYFDFFQSPDTYANARPDLFGYLYQIVVY